MVSRESGMGIDRREYEVTPGPGMRTKGCPCLSQCWPQECRAYAVNNTALKLHPQYKESHRFVESGVNKCQRHLARYASRAHYRQRLLARASSGSHSGRSLDARGRRRGIVFPFIHFRHVKVHMFQINYATNHTLPVSLDVMSQ